MAYMSRVFSLQHFLMLPQNSKSLKYWPNDKLRFMTGLFYSVKVLLYYAIFMNMLPGPF